MKKALAILLILGSLCSMASCGNVPLESTAETTMTTTAWEATTQATSSVETTTETTTEEIISEEETTTATEEEVESEYISGVETLDKYVDYKIAQAEFDAKRDDLYASEAKFDGVENYLPDDPTAKGLLTQDEIDNLFQRQDVLQALTYEQAVADIEYYFRVLKYLYGAYYYFGGDEIFLEAKQNVLHEIEGRFVIGSEDLEDILYENLIFVRDSRFAIGNKTPADDLQNRYEYFYSVGQNYAKDANGYYKLIDGVKWYYAGCENDAVSMEYSLDEEGRIVYSLIRFCSLKNENGVVSETDEIFLKNGDVTKKQIVEWQDSTPQGIYLRNYQILNMKDIAYMSLRSSDDPTATRSFVQAAKQAKDAKVIIYDLRSNAGGNIAVGKTWVEQFFNVSLEINGVEAYRLTAIRGASAGQESSSIQITDGQRISNDIPIIVLVDDLTAASAESISRYMTCIENVTVIGSNTKGVQLCDYESTLKRYTTSYCLPNSKIMVEFGDILRFVNDTINMDGIGYTPDIWCDPDDALDLVLNMIMTQGLVCAEDVNMLKEEMAKPPVVDNPVVTPEETTVEETTTERMPTIPEEEKDDYISGVETLDQYVDYRTAQAEFDAIRDELFASDETFEGFENYLPDDLSAKRLLTQSEIDLLRSGGGLRSSITYKEAVADVNLYFRALKYAYGAYYYFGGDTTFYEAKRNVLAAISGQSRISTDDLLNIIYENLTFVKDSHFQIHGKCATDDPQFRHEYFYAVNQNYAKDKKGYYKLIDGMKWYYAGCDNDAVSMEYSLDEKGRIVYSLVRFCPIKDEDGYLPSWDVIYLKNGDVTKKQIVEWQESVAYYPDGFRNVDFNYLKTNGIAYISVRHFDRDEYGDILERYVTTGADVKNAKLIIYDTRSNGGGASNYSQRWVENFSGVRPELKGAEGRRYNALWSYNSSELGNEHYDFHLLEGRRIKNDIPIIFLTDDRSGSSGEMVLLFTNCLENVTVIGSNTNGCKMGGNVSAFFLPNSKICVSFGINLVFYHEMKSVEGIGFMPDIWCNPKDALDIALKMIVTQGLASESDVNALKNRLPKELLNKD